MNKKIRMNIIHKLPVLPILLIPVLVLFISLCFSPEPEVSAEYGGLEEVSSVESVLVKKGDTVSSIAEKYAAKYSQISVKQYADDIYELNNMTSEHIKAGNYILLPNYRK